MKNEYITRRNQLSFTAVFGHYSAIRKPAKILSFVRFIDNLVLCVRSQTWLIQQLQCGYYWPGVRLTWSRAAKNKTAGSYFKPKLRHLGQTRHLNKTGINIMSTLLKTPLHDWHAAHGGRIVEFGGWAMPVQYGSIVTEHTATRTAVGLFDVSHMGRLIFTGPNALSFLDSLVTRRVSDQAVGQVRYGLLTNNAGCALDDILVYSIPASEGSEKSVMGPNEAYHLMVVNARNREKALAWIKPRLAATTGVTMTDVTTDVAMIAVQGPKANELVAKLAGHDPATLKYYNCRRDTIINNQAIISRTGYTGEDGCEIMLPSSAATKLWETLLQQGEAIGTKACGLGARDTLRLEAAMPLYGHELDDQTTPLDAGLDFAVSLKDRQFPGRDVLAAQKEQGRKKVRVGLEVEGKRAPREHYNIFAANASESDAPIGMVTSGTFSPTLQKGIAMGYVPSAQGAVGTEVQIDLRGTRVTAKVVPLPFYSRKK
jgi:aminomethyltransferase